MHSLKCLRSPLIHLLLTAFVRLFKSPASIFIGSCVSEDQCEQIILNLNNEKQKTTKRSKQNKIRTEETRNWIERTILPKLVSNRTPVLQNHHRTLTLNNIRFFSLENLESLFIEYIWRKMNYVKWIFSIVKFKQKRCVKNSKHSYWSNSYTPTVLQPG